MEHCPLIGRPCDFRLCRLYWNRAFLQLEEARGDVNRYYFWLAHGREAENDRELLAYYVGSGGAENFRLREMLNSPGFD